MTGTWTAGNIVGTVLLVVLLLLAFWPSDSWHDTTSREPSQRPSDNDDGERP